MIPPGPGRTGGFILVKPLNRQAFRRQNQLSFFVGSQETIRKLLRSNQYRHRLCRVAATNS
jgi:hypothetical protein